MFYCLCTSISCFLYYPHLYISELYINVDILRCVPMCVQYFNMLTFALIMFPCWFQKEEIKSCKERVKKLLEMTPPKGKDFLCKIDHIIECEKNWVSTLFSLSLSLSRYSLKIVMFAEYLNLCQISLVLGVVETWWLPTIWKATIGEENSSRWC